MIKKENFCKLLKALADQIEKDQQFANAMHPFFEGHSILTHTDSLQKTIIEVLENEMDDFPHSDYGSFISNWFYENDCGNSSASCVEIKGKKIELKTPEQLYDFLKKHK